MVSSHLTLSASLIMIALFVFAIISFSIGFAFDTDASISILDDPNVSGIYGSQVEIPKFKDDAEGTYESILKTTVEPGSDVAQSIGPFAITRSNILGVLKNVAYLPYKTIFGSGSGFGIFLTAFISFIVLASAFLFYKALRGNP